MTVIGMMVHRHQLDGSDAQIPQVAYGLIRSQASIGPAHRLGQSRMPSCEALDVQFVDDGCVPGRARLAVFSPRKSRVNDGGKHRKRRVVTGIERQILVQIAKAIAMHFIAPANVPANGPRVGFEHDLVRVESMPTFGVVRAVNPVAIQLSRKDAGNVAVPDEVRLLRKRDARRFARAVGGIEQAQLHLACMLGKDGEVDAGAVPGCAERIRGPRPDFHAGLVVTRLCCEN